MSSVVISGDTSGAITLAAPAVAGTTTLTLPATTGSVIGSNSSGDIQFNSGYGSVAKAYGCRAWVNFNGTGTVAIRASGNVTSITDGGVGTYTVNMTTAMPDANYAPVTNSAAVGSVNFQTPLAGTITTTTFDLYTSNGTTATDSSIVVAAVFR